MKQFRMINDNVLFQEQSLTNKVYVTFINIFFAKQTNKQRGSFVVLQK